MLDGITVLNTTEQVVYGFGWSTTSCIVAGVVILAITALIVLAVVTHIRGRAPRWDFIVEPFAWSVIIIGTIIWFSVSCVGAVKDRYNIYDVTIDDTVQFNDFTSRYEILEHNGQIYTIREIGH